MSGPLWERTRRRVYFLQRWPSARVMRRISDESTHQEFGVRLALGESAVSVLRLVIREGCQLSGLGAALGLVGVIAVTGALRGLLYGVTPLVGPTLAGLLPLWRSSPSAGRLGVRPASILRRPCAPSSAIIQAGTGRSRGRRNQPVLVLCSRSVLFGQMGPLM
jgi:hypothetical protein